MIVMDACSIINLSNSNSLRVATQLNAHRLAVSPAVIRECNSGAATEIMDIHAEGAIDFVDIDDALSERYFELITKLGLGDGETECIAVAEVQDCLICCDDRKARNAASVILGGASVLGSLRLLKWCVDEAHLTADEAFQAYRLMIDAGAFLPILLQDYFEAQE